MLTFYFYTEQTCFVHLKLVAIVVKAVIVVLVSAFYRLVNEYVCIVIWLSASPLTIGT